jgi:MFS family permease
MKRTVWTYGLISGAILALAMTITMRYEDRISMGAGYAIGYGTMILALLAVFFGIRSYRDNLLGGAIGFRRAFGVGILIALVASACYVASWQVVYRTMVPDFMEKYATRVIENERASGASEAQLEARRQEMAEFAEAYKNPLVNIGMTLLEILPVAVVVVLVSAWVASGRRAEVRAELA